jgi:hypothetical protein
MSEPGFYTIYKMSQILEEERIDLFLYIGTYIAPFLTVG